LLKKCLIKHVSEERQREEEEEDVSSYWMTLRNRYYSGN
jgi:hypothetical protein